MAEHFTGAAARLRGWPRRLAFCGLLGLTLLLVCTAAANAATAALPPEGIFDSCDLNTQMQTCVGRLAVMHAGGMKVVVQAATNGTAEADATYAGAAHWLGMSVMWEISDPNWWDSSMSGTSILYEYPSFVSACGCGSNGALLDYVARFLGSQAGTYGYYAADDSMLPSGSSAGVAAYVARLRQADPNHTVMIGSADQSQTGTYQRIADLIGTEIYPVTNSSLMPVASNQDTWGGVAQTASDAQSSADAAHKRSAVILQAFTWGDNLDDGQAIGVCSAGDSKLGCYSKLRYPSAAEQLQLRNEVLIHSHPSLILWWSFQGTYGQAGGDTYSIYPTGLVAAARWAGLRAAVQAPSPFAPQAGTARAASVKHVAAATARRTPPRPHRVTRRRRKVRKHVKRVKHAARAHIALGRRTAR